MKRVVSWLALIAVWAIGGVAIAADETPQLEWKPMASGRTTVELAGTKEVAAWVECPHPGGWKVEVGREAGEADGVEIIKVRLSAAKPAQRPELEIGFRRADGGRVRALWRPMSGKRCFNGADALPFRSHASFGSSFAYSMPLYAFLDSGDRNVLALGASEATERVLFRGGTEEGPNSILATFSFNTMDVVTPTNVCEVSVRCDYRPLAADRVLPAAAAWMRRVDPLPDYPVPESSFEPFYSSWCAYHQGETDAIIEREADEALKLGLKTVLIDWGWQNPPDKYLYYGPHIPHPRYSRDFAAHVKRLHEKGLRVVMWFPMTLVTDDNEAFARYRGRTLYRRGWGPYVWDPRFPELREYLLGCLETAVRDWQVDGLKLDYGDSWGIDYADKWQLKPLVKGLEGRDRAGVSDGAREFVTEMRRRLTAINPKVSIEFRQMYMGIGMLKGCTQMRVQDCPGSQRDIRNGIANLRMTCGPTAVMTDPVQWGENESDVQVAESIISSIFSVGQYSVRLTETRPSHKRLLAHWVRFQNEHRPALLQGDFRVEGLTYDAPVMIGETGDERIVGAYVPGFVADCGVNDRRIILLNGTGGESVLVRFAAPAKGTVYDHFGERVGERQVPAGVSEVRLPRGGSLEVAPEIVNDGCRNQPSVVNAKRPEKLDSMADYLQWKWRTDVTDPASGDNHETLKAGVKAVVEEWKEREEWALVKARVFDYLVDNTALGFSRFDCFPAIASWNRFDRPISEMVWAREREVEAQTAPKWLDEERAKVYQSGGKAYRDYDHSSPDWAEILKLGFPGIKARVDAYPDTPFYAAEKRTAAAIMRFLDRLIAGAEAELKRAGGKTAEGMLEREIASLRRLRVGPPVTVLDVMEFCFIDFVLSEYFDRFQVRSFGAIDALWAPYYERDLRAGRTTEAQFREDFRHFIWQFGSIDNYWGHPLCLGGTRADGTSAYNALSLIMLDVIDREALPTPKLQLKIAKHTPETIWDKALRMVRNHRSLVLMGEEGMARSMAKLGLTAEECRQLVVWGCFEWLPPEGNCTSACDINLVKPLEEMLREAKEGRLKGVDTFADFKREYYRRLKEVTARTCKVMDALESGIERVNPSLMLTLGVGRALESGKDAFATGMRYNHTAIAEVAFASTVDSLMAVKELVYGEGKVEGKVEKVGGERMSLQELGEVLARNWEGREELRLRMARSRRKWGCGDAETDALGREVLEQFTGSFVGRPNARGGKYCCYGLNSRGYILAGQATGATPDGRKAGEELSKNMAPAIGGDAEGVTAVLKSYRTSVDPEFFPCGLVFDMMLHSSSVAGEKGLGVLRAICEEFFAAGGCGLNLNIQSVEELKDAQLHPEKYENLQVRVAGWNIRWNDIPRVEQDGFIRRLEAMPE